MKTIPLTQGKFALVDDANYEWLNKHKWCAYQNGNTFYAAHEIRIGKYRRTAKYMHRLILGLRPGDKQQVDHRDGNGLNNQRSNLRVCTASQNHQSQRNLRIGTSMYKGVRWHHNRCKWYSQIQVNRKHIHLGSFNSEIDAARTYDIAALKHFGQFALTNKMMGLL